MNRQDRGAGRLSRRGRFGRLALALGLAWGGLLLPGALRAEPVAVYIHMPAIDVYACPRIDCQKLFTVRGGQKLEILERDKGWAKIAGKDGQGWIQRDYLNEK